MIRLYLTRLKTLSRNKANVFWAFLFPIILSTLFYMALGNIYSLENFQSIKVALIDNKNYDYSKEFQMALTDATTSNTGEGNRLFDVVESSLTQAQKLLNEDKIIGYILPGNDMQLTVKSSGIRQTITKSFMESYNQKLNTIQNIGAAQPESYPQVLENISNPSSYVTENPMGNHPPDITLNYYYALIAMACLFGSFWGLNEIMSIQGNLSWKGARINVAPIHKMKLLLCNMMSALTIHFIGILLLLSYLILALKINFGNDLGLVILTSFTSCLYGITLGAMICTFSKKNADFKSSVLAAVVMFSSFLAGLMMVEMKYIVATKVPFLQYVNPAHIITDAFYSLYYYENYSRFAINIMLMIGYSLLFSLITYLAVRRKKYASL